MFSIRHALLCIFLLCLSLYPASIAQAQQVQAPVSLSLYHLLNDASDISIPLLIRGNDQDVSKAIRSSGGTLIRQYGNITRADLNPEQINTLRQETGILWIDCPQGNFRLMNDVMIHHNKADSAQQGNWPLPQGYDGTGVIIGVIDAPFDYRHGDFTDAEGNTRIKYLWDQSQAPDGTEPLPYGYGIECDSQSVADETCPHIDYNYWYSHGSGVAGVAASSGNAANAYKGIAPNADLILVALDFESDYETVAIDAIDYVFSKAAELGKPCVINTSFGLYTGSHDGKDLTTQAIESMLEAQSGRALVAAAGNAGNQLIHLGYEVTATPQFTWFKKLSYTNLVYWQLWADTAELANVNFAIGADNPTGWVPKGSSPWFNIVSDFDLTGGAIDSLEYTLMDGPTTIGTATFYAQKIDGRYLLECYIVPAFSNYYWRLTTQGSGRFDLWGSETFTGFSNFVTTGLPAAGTVPDIVNYVLPDIHQTIVSGWQCSDHVLAIGSYVNRDTMTNYYGEHPSLIDTVGQLFYSSSRGPTRDGRIKPDITSTGSRVLTTGSSVLTEWLISLGAANYMSPDGMHYLQNGTSFASPAVTGIAALYLQKNPAADWSEVNDAILSNARRDSWTGDALPDNNWGYGKADAFRTLTGSWGCDSSNYMDPPAGLTAADITPISVALEWSLIPNASGYQIAYAPVAGGSVLRKKSPVNSKTIGGLLPGTTYSCKVRAACPDFGFSSWSIPFVFTTDPLREGVVNQAVIYPNPSSGTLHISYPGEKFRFRIMDLQGHILYSDQATEAARADLSVLPSGIYLVEFTDSSGSSSRQCLILE